MKDQSDREMARLTRRSLLTGAIATAAGAGLWAYVDMSPEYDNVPSALRRGLQVNEKMSRTIFNGDRLAPEFPLDKAVKKVRVNEASPCPCRSPKSKACRIPSKSTN